MKILQIQMPKEFHVMNVIYYTEINLLCIVILFLIRSQLHRHKTGLYSTARMIFNWLLWAAVLLCASDLVAGVCRGRGFFGVRAVLEISNLLFYEALAVISYLWMLYVYIKLEFIKTLDKKKFFLLALPLMAFSIVAVTNPFTHILFSFDENNLYTRGGGIYFHWLVTWSYLIIPTVQTICAIAREKNKFRRQEMIPLLYFIIPPAIASVVQMMFYGVSSSQTGITVSIVIIFLVMQSSQVLTDELTGLVNRRGLDNYLAGYSMHNADTELSLLMLDLNNFKQVNDKFGHIIGDCALQEAADALKKACETFPGKLFLCRYGGDEFIIIGKNHSQDEIARLKTLIHKEVETKNAEGTRPYLLGVSIGTAHGKCKDSDDIEYLIRLADEAMYNEKMQLKRADEKQSHTNKS